MSLPTDSKTLQDAVITRRSVYNLEKKSPIPDAEIRSIVEWAVKNCPSSFNVQSARAVLFLGAQHEKLWDIGDANIKAAVPPDVYEKSLGPKVKAFKAAYGTVAWFEDETALLTLQQKNPMIAGMVNQWSEHSSGMNQFAVWTAFEQAGLGANLQHYNYMPQFTKDVIDEWKLPAGWKLNAQLVFGQPASWDRGRERTYLPIEDRVKVFA